MVVESSDDEPREFQLLNQGSLRRRALAGREKELREDHPDTLTSVNNLVLVLRNRGKYEEAETLHRRALAGYEKELGVVEEGSSPIATATATSRGVRVALTSGL